MVAQGLLPYLELLTKGLVSPGSAPKEEGFSYLLSTVTEAQPAEGVQAGFYTAHRPLGQPLTPQWGRRLPTQQLYYH